MKALLSLVCSICILLLSCQNSGTKKQIDAGKIDSTAQPAFQKDIKVEMADAAKGTERADTRIAVIEPAIEIVRCLELRLER